MINKTHKQIVFVPYASAAEFTDPSYHLPAFYELWAKWANEDNSLWLEVALASRELFKKTCHTNTGLSPDYANFDGTPKTGWGDHHRFEYDAWRTIMNISIDYYWWKKDSWAVTQANRLLNFFYNEGVTTYGNRYELDGTKVGTPHSPGLVAMNATAALISTHPNRLAFVQDLWNIQPTTGTWRYPLGCGDANAAIAITCRPSSRSRLSICRGNCRGSQTKQCQPAGRRRRGKWAANHPGCWAINRAVSGSIRPVCSQPISLRTMTACRLWLRPADLQHCSSRAASPWRVYSGSW